LEKKPDSEGHGDQAEHGGYEIRFLSLNVRQRNVLVGIKFISTDSSPGFASPGRRLRPANAPRAPVPPGSPRINLQLRNGLKYSPAHSALRKKLRRVGHDGRAAKKQALGRRPPSVRDKIASSG